MLSVHKEAYKIDGEEYTAVANFVDDALHIYGRGFKESCALGEYTNFEGNMEAFIKAKIKGKSWKL